MVIHGLRLLVLWLPCTKIHSVTLNEQVFLMQAAIIHRLMAKVGKIWCIHIFLERHMDLEKESQMLQWLGKIVAMSDGIKNVVFLCMLYMMKNECLSLVIKQRSYLEHSINYIAQVKYCFWRSLYQKKG